MKLLPTTRSDWRKTALFAACAPFVAITLANIVAYHVYCNHSRLGLNYFMVDGFLQAIQLEVFALIFAGAAVSTLILCVFFLFVDRRLAGLGFFVLAVSAFSYCMTPIIIHE